MKFDTPAQTNPIDQLKVIGKPVDRIDGPLKTTGTAPYANDRHDVAARQTHGYVIGSAISRGRRTCAGISPESSASSSSRATPRRCRSRTTICCAASALISIGIATSRRISWWSVPNTYR